MPLMNDVVACDNGVWIIFAVFDDAVSIDSALLHDAALNALLCCVVCCDTECLVVHLSVGYDVVSVWNYDNLRILRILKMLCNGNTSFKDCFVG